MIVTLTRKLFDKLRRKTYREAYVEENVRTYVAAQIRALREQRGLTQKQFGGLIGKPASVISRIEDPDYGRLTTQTLLEVAAALDVALLIEYVDFPEFIARTRNVSPEALQRLSFSEAQFVTESSVKSGTLVFGGSDIPVSLSVAMTAGAGITGATFYGGGQLYPISHVYEPQPEDATNIPANPFVNGFHSSSPSLEQMRPMGSA